MTLKRCDTDCLKKLDEYKKFWDDNHPKPGAKPSEKEVKAKNCMSGDWYFFPSRGGASGEGKWYKPGFLQLNHNPDIEIIGNKYDNPELVPEKGE